MAESIIINIDQDKVLQQIKELEKQLLEKTGHELLKPANQYCKHCGEPMFVKEASQKPCSVHPPKRKIK